VQAADRGVVDGEVQDGEQVARALRLRVRVDLGPLAPREHVLDVERMPAEARCELLDLLVGRRLEVDPGETVLLELSDRALRGLGQVRRLAGAARADAWQARHRY